MDEVIINIENVTKEYYDKKFFKKRSIIAVNNLDLQIKRGEIFGLLGPNGAGKTTTMNMIIGYIKPSKGTIRVFDQRIGIKWLGSFRTKLGYLPETPTLHDYFEVEGLLDFYGSLFGLSPKQKKKRIDILLDEFGLQDKRREGIKCLSIGQKRALGFAQALINDPELLILDEPTVYLDPIILNRFRSLLIKLKEKGKTILLSSHTLSEIEKLSDRVAIMDKGNLVALKVTRELTKHSSLDEEFLKLIGGN